MEARVATMISTILLTVAACPLKDTLTRDSTAALMKVPGVSAVDVTLDSDCKSFSGPLAATHGPQLAFEPHFGWKGHVEVGAEGA